MLAGLDASEWDHLASYKLVSAGDSIVVVTPQGGIYDVDRHPGTMMSEVLLRDVLAEFEAETGRLVPALPRPKPRLSVDPAVLGGYPVVAGTRVPFDVVAGLASEGYAEAEIIELYPSVKPGAVDDARAFAKDVAAAA